MDKFLANSQYGVHLGTSQNFDRTLKAGSLSPGFIEDCFEELVRLGMSREPRIAGQKSNEPVPPQWHETPLPALPGAATGATRLSQVTEPEPNSLT